MINSKLTPIEWSTLLYELGDAKEHLESLVNEMVSKGEISETDYEIQIGHIFAHLNRGWNTRNRVGDYSDDEREKYTSFPIDIEPCG